VKRTPHIIPDRLWVRESFRFPAAQDEVSPAVVGTRSVNAGYNEPWCPTEYADGCTRNDNSVGPFGRKRSAMHMPRWASRIVLEITNGTVHDFAFLSCSGRSAYGPSQRPRRKLRASASLS